VLDARQLACLCIRANGLRPSHDCIALATARSPVSSRRCDATAARTVSVPIQIAVMVRRSVTTYKSTSNPGSIEQRSTISGGVTTSHQFRLAFGRSE